MFLAIAASEVHFCDFAITQGIFFVVQKGYSVL